MRQRHEAARRRTVAALLAVPLLVTIPAVPAAAEDEGSPVAAGSPVVDSRTVGLITGDIVTVQVFPDGQRGIEVALADRDGGQVGYDILDQDGDVYVVPSDAWALVPDALDLELFNVTKLIDYGYDLEYGLPVISAPAVPGQARTMSAPSIASFPGVRDALALPSIDGTATTVDSGGPAFWRALTGPRTLSTPDKIWLDEQIEATLDESVPMVGAPLAWAAGYDGSEMTVAVLDSGIDADHPDFAGRIAGTTNFTFSPDAHDRNGHGTHVAGIVAGSGQASDGSYAGVAPGASLLAGKVLGDAGTGQISWGLAGMEWAIENGADVINMSLGTSSASNGFDLQSRAVNELSLEHDVLFVISAGNLGPGSWTISAPGAASEALTVGAVDRTGELAWFSSRGPRLVPRLRHIIGGEFTIKPDITAPGVGIAAPRASGTSRGSLVDQHYTRLSGTSMAAPHVAGAAAILRQQRPELSAAEVKAALVTAATPNQDLTVYQQGGGLLDIPAALAAPVVATPAPLDFGSLDHPYDDTAPVSADVTFTSVADQPVTLDLSLDVTSPEAGAPGEAVLRATPAQLELAPGESADVTVTLDPRDAAFGTYGGYLVATDGTGEVVSQVPTGFWLEPPTHTLTIEAIDRNGEPADAPGTLIDVADAQDLNTFGTLLSLFRTGGTASVEVPEGRYAVIGRIPNPHPVFREELSIVAAPELTVTEDTTVVLDARTANEVTVDTPQHETSRLPNAEVMAGFNRETGAGQSLSRVFTAPATTPIYVAEAEAPPTGDLTVFTRQLLGTADATVLYDAVLVESGGVPADLHYVLDADELAAVTNRYHSDLPNQVVHSARFAELPGWEGWDMNLSHAFSVPVERTDYYVGGGPAEHRQRVNLNGSTLPTLFTQPQAYAAGERRTQTWFARPIAPGLGEPAVRDWDTLRVDASPWVDPGGNALEGSVAYSFFQDGELLEEGTDPSALPLSADPAEYRLELRAAADRSWWQTSTAATTAWTVHSARGGHAPEVVPLLQLDYDLGLDLSNTAPRPGSHGPPFVDIRVSHPDGAAAAPVAGARLWTSYDDGASWRARPGRARGDGRYEFVLDLRDPVGTNRFASLRVEAWDTAGNRVEQEVIRAYALPPRGDTGPEPAGDTERVSVATDGTQADRGSSAPPAISADGRYVAFASLARNLVPGEDATLAGGVFVRDLETGTTERVSVASDGTPATASSPAISADGRYVAFASNSPDLVPDKTTSSWDVYVHDRQTGQTERVSVATDGSEGDSGTTSSGISISADGRHVAFAGYATNLVPGDTNGAQDVFVHDRQTGETERVSVASDGTETPQFTSSSSTAISADGRYVGFQSSAPNLVPDDTNNQQDVFVHDRQTGQTELVSVGSDGAQADNFSSNASISADGRYVAFVSYAANLVLGDTNGWSDVFVHDRQTGETERVSVASDGTQPDTSVLNSAISPDGQFVGFGTRAANLVPGDTNKAFDLFMHDRQTGQTERISVAQDGTEANAGSSAAFTISADGLRVAFTSGASNLVPADTNGQSDVFVRHRSQE